MKNILNNIQQLIVVIARSSMFPERRGNLRRSLLPMNRDHNDVVLILYTEVLSFDKM